jgi:hypothetical protein
LCYGAAHGSTLATDSRCTTHARAARCTAERAARVLHGRHATKAGARACVARGQAGLGDDTQYDGRYASVLLTHAGERIAITQVRSSCDAAPQKCALRHWGGARTNLLSLTGPPRLCTSAYRRKSPPGRHDAQNHIGSSLYIGTGARFLTPVDVRPALWAPEETRTPPTIAAQQLLPVLPLCPLTSP